MRCGLAVSIFLTYAPRSAARSTHCQNTTCSAQTLGVRWCGHDSSLRVHLVTFRPLQLSSVRCGISDCPTYMCSGVYRPYRMLQHAWSLAPEGVTTSPRSCSNYTGYQYDSEWNLSSLSWSTRRSTTWHHRICQTIASSLSSPGAVSFDHQTISVALWLVAVHLLEIEHSLLPDHAFGTVFLYKMSVDLIYYWTPSAANWKLIELF